MFIKELAAWSYNTKRRNRFATIADSGRLPNKKTPGRTGNRAHKSIERTATD